MSDLISRKALIEWLISHFDLELDEPLEKEMIRLINDQPTIQPQGIDKDRLIEFLRKEVAEWQYSDEQGMAGAYSGQVAVMDILDWVNQQPQTGWIPCSGEDRLTERDCEGIVGFKGLMRYYNFNDFQKMARKLLYYEDLAEQGRLAYLPQPYKESE